MVFSVFRSKKNAPILSTTPTTSETSDEQPFHTNAPVTAVAVTPDARYLAIGTSPDIGIDPYTYTNKCKAKENPTVTIYETESQAVRATITKHKWNVLGVSLSTDAAVLASCDGRGYILISDGTTGDKRTRLGGHSETVWDICFDADGTHVASAGDDGTVRYWDTATSTCVHKLRGHYKRVTAVSIAANARVILSCGGDGKLCGWDIRTGREAFMLNQGSSVWDCAIDSDARISVSCTGYDKEVLVWDWRNTEVFQKFEIEGTVEQCDMTPTGSRVVTTNHFNKTENQVLHNMHAWDVDSGEEIFSFEITYGSDLIGFFNPTSVCITSDGERVVCSQGNQATMLRLQQANTEEGTSLALSTQEDTSVEFLPEIESVYCDYINNGIPLTADAVTRAIETDFKRNQVSKLSTVYVGHVCVRTILSSGQKFSNDDNDDAGDTVNLYLKLYHKISEVIKCESSLEFAERILKDAQTAHILSQHDVNSILGDARSNEYTRDLLSEFATVMNEVYKNVTSRIATMESRLQKISFDMSSLCADVDKMETKMERDAKMRRYANLVKFGLALIPFVGSAAMAFVDGSVGVIMSLDVESVVGLITGLVSTTGQAIVDGQIGRVAIDGETEGRVGKEKQAVQVVQYFLSEGFLNKLEGGEREEIVEGLEREFGGNLESLRGVVEDIVNEHAELEGGDERVQCVDMIEESSEIREQCSEMVEQRSELSERGCFDDGRESGLKESLKDDGFFGKRFKSAAGGREEFSHTKACELLTEVVESKLSNSGVEGLSNLVSDTLMAETDDKVYSLIDEACFVRAGKWIVASMRRNDAKKKWGRAFDKAANGDSEILRSKIAARMIAALISVEGLDEEDVAQQIKARFGERDFLSRDEFILVAVGLVQ